MANSRPVQSLALSSRLFLCLPGLLPPFTVPCKMVLAAVCVSLRWSGGLCVVRSPVSRTKNYSILFKEPFHQQLCTLPCRENTGSTPQPRLVWGMSSTILVNARRAPRTVSNRVPFSRFFTSGDRKRSQGERSGEYGGCGCSCTSLSLRKSTVVAAVCAMSLSRGIKRPRSPVFGRRWYQSSKTFGRQ